jgi:DnaJ family protein C protein 2
VCSRDEKRHQEKKNKSERAKRKKEDIARVRVLVDKALGLDPRIKQFKADEKEARDAKKRGGPVVDVKAQEDAAKAAKEAAEKLAKEEEEKAASDKVSPFTRSTCALVLRMMRVDYA